MRIIIKKKELESLRNASCDAPHALLGLHHAVVDGRSGLVARAFLSEATRCEVVDVGDPDGQRYPLERLSEDGFFEGFIEDRDEVFTYRFRIETHELEVRQYYDPYSFLPTIGESDLYLFNEGTERRIFEKLGSRIRVINGVPGVSFAVWAPNAKRVSVVGSFNRWDGRYHPMRNLATSGVWELFIPGLRDGEMYKYEIVGSEGVPSLKADPYGSYFEAPPNNATIVYDHNNYEWGDRQWMDEKTERQSLDKPMSVYEVHLGSWKRRWEEDHRPLSYSELAKDLAEYALDHCFTHIELMPVAEHPFDGSWGYQVTGYFAPTQRFGSPDDFKAFIDYLHQRGLGVIVDWVPAHFPRDAFALPGFDGTHLYEHEDPRLGAHQDWGTLIFNYGRHEVKCFLISNALAWIEYFHIDGLRVDAVASMLYLDYSREDGEWIPNQYGGNENLEAIAFIKETNRLVHELHPGTLMIAEESTSFPGVTKSPEEGGLGFDLKWNMGWMHDNLRYFEKDPIYRKYHQGDLTFGMLYQYAENFITVFSHDEVTHGKGSMIMKMGARSISEKSQTLRALYGHMWAYPGKKLLFMGGEFGQSEEWNYATSLQWHLNEYKDHSGIAALIRDLNQLYRTEPALAETDFIKDSFRWIACWDSEAGVISYSRTAPDGHNIVMVLCHFTPVERNNYRIGLPRAGYWKEVLNTNSGFYGGSDLGNGFGIHSESLAFDDLDQSAEFVLPPCSTIVFKWEG